VSAPCTWKPRHLQPGSGWERAPEAGERERPEALPAALPRCGPGPERSARGQGGAGEDKRAREWTLVRALGAARGAPPDGAYLAALAARGSWVRLLAEADSQAYPLRLVRSGPCTLLGFLMPPAHMQAIGLCRMSSADSNRAGRWKPCGGALGAVERGDDRAARCRGGQVAAAAARHLPDASLRHHVLRVVHSLAPRLGRAVSLSSTLSFAAPASARRPAGAPPAGAATARPELFGVLAAAEASRRAH